MERKYIVSNFNTSFQSNTNDSTKHNLQTMSNSNEKIRLHITSPTFDDSDDVFTSISGGFVNDNKSPQLQSATKSDDSSKHQLASSRVDREDSPTERYCRYILTQAFFAPTIL